MLHAQAQQIEDQNRRIQILEERLRMNLRNSSTPPSADPQRPASGKSPSGKKRGAQLGHSGKARALLSPEQITHTHDCVPGPRPACGGAVRIAGLCGRHQVTELPPILPVVTEYRLLAGTCCTCGQVCEAGLLPGVSRRVTGPRLLADLFGIELPVGAIGEGEAEIGAALQDIV